MNTISDFEPLIYKKLEWPQKGAEGSKGFCQDTDFTDQHGLGNHSRRRALHSGDWETCLPVGKRQHVAALQSTKKRKKPRIGLGLCIETDQITGCGGGRSAAHVF